jgi:hypothetical protein
VRGGSRAGSKTARIYRMVTAKEVKMLRWRSEVRAPSERTRKGEETQGAETRREVFPSRSLAQPYTPATSDATFCRVNLSSARRATSFFSLHQPVDAPLIPFNMPYDDAHRALVQAFLGRRVMTVDEAKPVFAAILSVASKEFRCSPSTAPSR